MKFHEKILDSQGVIHTASANNLTHISLLKVDI